MKETEPSPTPLRIFFFVAGIVATLAYRAIIVLNFYSALLVKIFWYIGTVGFVIYFYHRYLVQKKKAWLVEKYNLVEMAEKAPAESRNQAEALEYIVKTSLTSRSRWNSIFIFLMSVLALLVGIALDLGLVGQFFSFLVK